MIKKALEELLDNYRYTKTVSDGIMSELKYQLSQSTDEIEFYRDMYVNVEEDFQDLKSKYMQLKKTVIKVFKMNQRLKDKNDSLTFNINKLLHLERSLVMENRKLSQSLKDKNDSLHKILRNYYLLKKYSDGKP